VIEQTEIRHIYSWGARSRRAQGRRALPATRRFVNRRTPVASRSRWVPVRFRRSHCTIPLRATGAARLLQSRDVVGAAVPKVCPARTAMSATTLDRGARDRVRHWDAATSIGNVAGIELEPEHGWNGSRREHRARGVKTSAVAASSRSTRGLLPAAANDRTTTREPELFRNTNAGYHEIRKRHGLTCRTPSCAIAAPICSWNAISIAACWRPHNLADPSKGEYRCGTSK